MKKFIIFFICVPLVYSELHRFMTTYTEINGQTAAGTPEFSAVTTLDDHQIDYYDSNIKKLILKQDWMKKFASTHTWKEYIDIREKQQQIYKINIDVLMETFTQSHGLHTYQRMYGCDWDDETGDSHGFDQYGYDGEDFISLDLKENRYTASVPQAHPTVMKWNNDRTQLRYLKEYYDRVCVYWLKEFLHVSKATDPPEVSLLQKNPDYYTCHATGFLFRNTSISWRKNGKALSDSRNLVFGDTLPNGDGTFQRRLTLYVNPDIHEDQYSCVVEHKSLTETIQKSMTVNKTKRSRSASDASYIIYPALVIITVIVGLIGLCVLRKHWKKLKAYSKKRIIYFKTKHAPGQDSQDSLLSTRSYESTPPPEVSYAAPHDSFSEINMINFQHLPFHSSSPVDGSSQPFLTTEFFYKVQETSKDP
ncbi:major histocompatibility complex class I-related gene protein-like [Rhinichthys klamathensis goyatoka]|uniref:major histocompatibility complex class I-related gene protein-like n=1 Tax=Rhinichthys klamathensis goyatoka TaxID=3034132 RepID=UPI0024B4F32F|nr:major histocompatibility complex class I-related gene protein-like [Rhinichthys klamathensis goyatoka]